MSAPDIVAFIEARMAEAEVKIKACAKEYPPPWDVSDRGYMAKAQAGEPAFPIVVELEQEHSSSGVEWLSQSLYYFADWQPPVAQEWIDATRRIIARYKRYRDGPLKNPARIGMYVALGEVLIDLAYVWHDHPDWDESWEVK